MALPLKSKPTSESTPRPASRPVSEPASKPLESKPTSESTPRPASKPASKPMTSRADGYHAEETVSVEQIKRESRERRLRAVRSLAARMQVAPDGSRNFIRFSLAQCLEHYVLIASFGILAATGLLQTFSRFFLVGWVIHLLGGVETLRTAHHLASIVLILTSVYHVEQILVMWFVKRERGGMWPLVRDFRDLVQMVMFNVGLSEKRPEFDRFNVEQKLEYWASLLSVPVMIITGLIIWFPVMVTSVLPGDVIPVAQAIHSRQAVLVTLAILTWHIYHTTIKERNRSVFTGIMTEEEMQHAHPLEYRRILAAHEHLQKIVE